MSEIFEPAPSSNGRPLCAYTKEALVAVLGEPADEGFVDHPMLSSHRLAWTPSAWGVLVSEQTNPDRFLRWDCFGRVPRFACAEDVGIYCFAIWPRHGPANNQGWFVVHLCTKHEGLLSETGFQELLADPLPDITPTLLIVDEESFERKAGPDWDRVQTHKRAGKHVKTVQRHEQLPGKVIVLLEAP